MTSVAQLLNLPGSSQLSIIFMISAKVQIITITQVINKLFFFLLWREFLQGIPCRAVILSRPAKHMM